MTPINAGSPPVATATKKPRLQVLISTHQSLARVAAMPLPQVDGVEYLISCQSEPLPIPDALQRPDVQVHFNATKGLSNNRNAALNLATAPFVLIGDDDLIYHADGLRAAMDAFDTNPAIDLFFFRHDGPSKKAYPAREADLSKECGGYNPTSFEIGLRMPTTLRFNPAFGIGAPVFASGEEAILLVDARKKRLGIRFFPITLCEHPGLSTGLRAGSMPGVLMAEGAVIRRRFPATSLPRLLLKALRAKAPFISTLNYLLKGWSSKTE